MPPTNSDEMAAIREIQREIEKSQALAEEWLREVPAGVFGLPFAQYAGEFFADSDLAIPAMTVQVACDAAAGRAWETIGDPDATATVAAMVKAAGIALLSILDYDPFDELPPRSMVAARRALSVTATTLSEELRFMSEHRWPGVPAPGTLAIGQCTHALGESYAHWMAARCHETESNGGTPSLASELLSGLQVALWAPAITKFPEDGRKLQVPPEAPRVPADLAGLLWIAHQITRAIVMDFMPRRRWLVELHGP